MPLSDALDASARRGRLTITTTTPTLYEPSRADRIVRRWQAAGLVECYRTTTKQLPAEQNHFGWLPERLVTVEWFVTKDTG